MANEQLEAGLISGVELAKLKILDSKQEGFYGFAFASSPEVSEEELILAFAGLLREGFIDIAASPGIILNLKWRTGDAAPAPRKPPAPTPPQKPFKYLGIDAQSVPVGGLIKCKYEGILPEKLWLSVNGATPIHVNAMYDSFKIFSVVAPVAPTSTNNQGTVAIGETAENLTSSTGLTLIQPTIGNLPLDFVGEYIFSSGARVEVLQDGTTKLWRTDGSLQYSEMKWWEHHKAGSDNFAVSALPNWYGKRIPSSDSLSLWIEMTEAEFNNM